MDDLLFSRAFLDVHRFIGAGHSVSHFAAVANPEALGFTSRADYYKPVRFRIKLAGEDRVASGIALMDIPVQANPNWFDDLKARVAKMMGLPSRTQLDICDVTGKSIGGKTFLELTHVGQLDVFCQDRRKRLRRQPETPAEYSVSKAADIQAWVDVVAGQVPDMVADQLANKGLAGVNHAICENGAVHQRIRGALKQAVPGGDWPEFCRVMAKNSPKTPNKAQANALLSDASKLVLSYVRSFIAANGEQIHDYVSAMQAKRLAQTSGESKLQAPVLGKGLISSNLEHVTTATGRSMYQRQMEDAMGVPTLKASLCKLMYYQKARSEATATFTPLPEISDALSEGA